MEVEVSPQRERRQRGGVLVKEKEVEEVEEVEEEEEEEEEEGTHRRQSEQESARRMTWMLGCTTLECLGTGPAERGKS